ncbi:MAG: HlyD family secretion protein [Methylomicrobium sp.]
MSKNIKSALILVGVVVAVAVLWWVMRPKGLPPGIAAGNGRIEATEIDIAAKIPGRIVEVLAREGDFVQPGEVVARMDTLTLRAQRAEAQAQVHRAQDANQTTQSLVAQRRSELAAAEAVVAQRRAELGATEKRLRRSLALVDEGAASRQQLDDERAQMLSAQAAVSAAQAQVAAARAAIEAAQSQVVEARSAIDAAKATVERLQADIDDSELKSPVLGRVQYRIAEPGEVLGAGGRVLNLMDLTDVYMTFFLPTEQAGKVALGSDIRLVLDFIPNYVIPAKASFVASVAQFTPKTVETESERLKLMFRVKANVAPELLKQYLEGVKTGLPGVAYVKIDPAASWPASLEVRLPPPRP